MHRLTRFTRWASILISLAVSMSGLAGSSTAVAGSQGPDSGIIQPPPEVAPADAIEAAVRFREDTGLDPEVSTVVRLSTDETADRSSYGYPLTEDEVAYLDRREAAVREMDGVRDYLSQFSDTFAGMYLDNRSAREADLALKLIVLATSPGAIEQSRLAELLPLDSGFEVRAATHTYGELSDVVTSIEKDRAWHRTLGIDVYLAGVDEVRNMVLVGISKHDVAAANALADRYGRDRTYIYVSAPPSLDACTRTACPPPWRSGINIDSGTFHCTLGFSVRSSTGNWYMLTAGHCPGDHWYHNGTFMGATPSGKDLFYDGSTSDVQAFDVANGNQSNVLLTGTKTCNPCSFRTMTGRQSYSADGVGETICISGAYGSTSNCGVLKVRAVSFLYADYGVTLSLQRVASYTRASGDSGGPIFSSTLAKGSHVHYQSDTGWAVYSQIHNIELALGLSMCFSGC